jgi:hypothetical protein
VAVSVSVIVIVIVMVVASLLPGGTPPSTIDSSA